MPAITEACRTESSDDPAGMATPTHPDVSELRMPSSANVGTSGSSAMRVLLATASGLMKRNKLATRRLPTFDGAHARASQPAAKPYTDPFHFFLKDLLS